MTLQLSSRFVRDPRALTLHVEEDNPTTADAMAVVDAVAWAQDVGKTRVRVVYGNPPPWVAEPAATLVAALRGGVAVDLEGAAFKPPDFGAAREDWSRAIEKRAGLPLPPLARHLSREVDRPSFRWYRTVTGHEWSGRVEGLEVCLVKGKHGDHGVLDVGKVGKNGAESIARKEFHRIAGRRREFRAADVTCVALLIRALADERSTPSRPLNSVEREHHLESRVLRGDIRLHVPPLLAPVCPDLPFQFPTLWSSGGRPRYVDALLCAGDVPWIAELKLHQPGQYLRHAIGQAVLYREFIRRARKLHPWFTTQNLKPERCEAVVVVEGPPIAAALIDLAKCFGVEMIHV